MHLLLLGAEVEDWTDGDVCDSSVSGRDALETQALVHPSRFYPEHLSAASPYTMM